VAEPRRRKLPWRRWINVLHRDLGYFAFGLTVIYAISGLAVNHIRDWNPTWAFERVERRFEPLPVTDRDTMVEDLVRVLDLGERPREAFRTRPEVIELFYDGWSVKADVRAGVARVERPVKRPLLGAFNDLHLNRPGGLWTAFADAYAVVLLLLAVTGLFVLKGRNGLWGRGKYFAVAGLLLPLLFLWML
jgi:hypothetical protein